MAASSAIAGLGVGLVVSALATASAAVAVVAGAPGDGALLSPLVALIAYPAIALSVDGFNLSRYRAGMQLAQLHDSFRLVTKAKNSPPTPSTRWSRWCAFAVEAVLLLLLEDGQLSISAPHKLPPQWTPERVARVTAKAFTSVDRSPLVDAMRTGATIGILHVSFCRVNAIDADELALLEAYGEQAALVLARTRAYELVANASKLKSEFLGTISHELRTPLAATKGFIDVVLMQWDSLDDAKRRELLERAGVNADELAALIDQLLDVSRLEAGETKLVAALRPRRVEAPGSAWPSSNVL